LGQRVRGGRGAEISGKPKKWQRTQPGKKILDEKTCQTQKVERGENKHKNGKPDHKKKKRESWGWNSRRQRYSEGVSENLEPVAGRDGKRDKARSAQTKIPQKQKTRRGGKKGQVELGGTITSSHPVNKVG